LRDRKCWGKLKDAATRCVLRLVDASKCVCGQGPAAGTYSAPTDPQPDSGEVNGEGECKGLWIERERRGRKGRDGTGEGREGE